MPPVTPRTTRASLLPVLLRAALSLIGASSVRLMEDCYWPSLHSARIHVPAFRRRQCAPLQRYFVEVSPWPTPTRLSRTPA